MAFHSMSRWLLTLAMMLTDVTNSCVDIINSALARSRVPVVITWWNSCKRHRDTGNYVHNSNHFCGLGNLCQVNLFLHKLKRQMMVKLWKKRLLGWSCSCKVKLNLSRISSGRTKGDFPEPTPYRWFCTRDKFWIFLHLKARRQPRRA